MDITKKRVRSLFCNFVPDSWLQERLELASSSSMLFSFHLLYHCSSPWNVLTTIITWGVFHQPLALQDVEKLDQKNPIRPIKHTQKYFLMWFYVLSWSGLGRRRNIWKQQLLVFLNVKMYAPLGTKFHKSLKGFSSLLLHCVQVPRKIIIFEKLMQIAWSGLYCVNITSIRLQTEAHRFNIDFVDCSNPN